MHCLIAEDEQVTQALLHAALEPHGQCDLASTGSEAVAMFQTALDNGMHYDLICMDIKMSGIDGLEALRYIRAIEKAKMVQRVDYVKIFIISSFSNLDSIKTAFYEIECDEYIQKPINYHRLNRYLTFHNLVNSFL